MTIASGVFIPFNRMKREYPTEEFCRSVLQEIIDRQNKWDKDDSFDLCAELAKYALENGLDAPYVYQEGWLGILVWNNVIADFAHTNWYKINSFTHSLEFEDVWNCLEPKEMTYIKYVLTVLDIAWMIVHDEIEQRWEETLSM